MMNNLHDALTTHFLALWLHNKEIINLITLGLRNLREIIKCYLWWIMNQIH